MPSSFIAYIDESGCDGFHFAKGSSEWLVLAGIVLRKSSEIETLRVVDQVRQHIGRPYPKDLHFRELKHDQKVVYAQQIGASSMRACLVLVHKPSIREPGTFQAKNRLYHYAVRFLLERISWICESSHRPGDGDGAVEITFSHRRNTPHVGIQEYLNLLMQQQTQINWNVISSDRVTAVPHKQRKGLLVADAVASSFWAGLEAGRLGITEGRYASSLRRIVWNRKKIYSGNGLKLFPNEAHETLDQEKHDWLFDQYGFPGKK